MTTNNYRFHRRSVRLKDYDYSLPGAYFVTLVTRSRDCIFGAIQGEGIALSRAGQIVELVWKLIPNYFLVRLDEWIVMPNHFHGIIVIDGPDFGKGEAGGKELHLPQSAPLPSASPQQPNRAGTDRGGGVGKGEADGNELHLPQSALLSPASPQRPNDMASNRPAGTVPGSLGAIIHTFKSMTTYKINALQKTPGGMIWQRNYYEHIIRSEEEWERIRLYIQVNPLRWEEDDENPSAAMR
jgi:REP element-mobilizing transposase RayT